ncbi:MAG: hypothetical protein ABI354_02765 [Candidatus Saccharimonadales bacterium]
MSSAPELKREHLGLPVVTSEELNLLGHVLNAAIASRGEPATHTLGRLVAEANPLIIDAMNYNTAYCMDRSPQKEAGKKHRLDFISGAEYGFLTVISVVSYIRKNRRDETNNQFVRDGTLLGDIPELKRETLERFKAIRECQAVRVSGSNISLPPDKNTILQEASPLLQKASPSKSKHRQTVILRYKDAYTSALIPLEESTNLEKAINEFAQPTTPADMDGDTGFIEGLTEGINGAAVMYIVANEQSIISAAEIDSRTK